jgi:phosphoribosylglycinamide formyltransferase 1
VHGAAFLGTGRFGCHGGPFSPILPAVDVRVAVLASGAGTNLQALLDDATVGPSVDLVVSDHHRAGALERARTAGVRGIHLDPRAHASREEHDRQLVSLLEAEGIGLVCLAGYMRILGPAVVRRWWGRILNVHPSLLPAFPGANAVQDALAWGVRVTGCTVHLVDEEVDHGPIVAQEAVPVFDDDDEGSLHARIREVEHRLYPAAVRAVMAGRIRVDGRRVRLTEQVR